MLSGGEALEVWEGYFDAGEFGREVVGCGMEDRDARLMAIVVL